MKRFHFQLEPVLDYKQQLLDSLMAELSNLQAQARQQEERRDLARQQLAAYDEEGARKREEGMTIIEAMEHDTCQRVLVRQLKREEAALVEANARVERKRREVVEARQGTFTLEKLRDIRRKEYDDAVAKAEERTLEDLTAARRAAAQAAV